MTILFDDIDFSRCSPDALKQLSGGTTYDHLGCMHQTPMIMHIHAGPAAWPARSLHIYAGPAAWPAQSMHIYAGPAAWPTHLQVRSARDEHHK